MDHLESVCNGNFLSSWFSVIVYAFLAQLVIFDQMLDTVYEKLQKPWFSSSSKEDLIFFLKADRFYTDHFDITEYPSFLSSIPGWFRISWGILGFIRPWAFSNLLLILGNTYHFYVVALLGLHWNTPQQSGLFHLIESYSLLDY